MTTTVRDAIRERLDPVIEEIVSREVNERREGGEEGGISGRERPFESLAPVLLATMARRREGKEEERAFESLLPILLATQARRREGGIEALLPILLVTQARRSEGKDRGIEALLPILLIRR